jgi:hypothetical protein
MLLEPVRPPLRDGIDLRCCDCDDLEWLAACEGASLCIADPPWTYAQVLRDVGDLNPEEREAGKPSTPRYTTGSPSDYYPTLTVSEIVRHLESVTERVPCLAVWLTWPLLGEWTEATQDARLPRLVTGGAWCKSSPGDAGHYGPGHWWAGCSEPVLVYGGATVSRDSPLRNAWIEPPREHSRKPARWMAGWIRRWTDPGDLIVDPYAGLGSVAEAVVLAGEGRRYLGAEIDAERHAAALSLIAQTPRGPA